MSDRCEHGMSIDLECADCIADENYELLEELKTLRETAQTVIDAFDDGVFVRSIDHDHKPGWAFRVAKPLAALGALKAFADEGKD